MGRCTAYAVSAVLAIGAAGQSAGTEVQKQTVRQHAVLQVRGDLVTAESLRRFTAAIQRLDSGTDSLIVVQLEGNRARADLLVDAIDAILAAQADVAVFLADRADRRVGPGQVALALAADRASIDPACRVVRERDDSLEHLNPGIEDWAVLGLDLRERAKQIATRRGISPSDVEPLVAPRSDIWLASSTDGKPTLVDEPGARAKQVVTRSKDGWTFNLGATEAAAVFSLGQAPSARAFARSAGARGRAAEQIELETDLDGAHTRCLVLIREARAGTKLADAALDIWTNRRGRAAILPRDYHAAADQAEGLVTGCRSMIAEIASLTDRLPEILEMEPPVDARTPTEIGGPSRNRLSMWRAAVQDAERELSYLDERIAEYRRR